MPYWSWLILLSITFLIAERLYPRRPSQQFLRQGIYTDVIYVALNGHFLGMILALGANPLEKAFNSLLQNFDIHLHQQLASTLPWAAQFAFAFFLVDFVQWAIHNLMHRIPWFWQFHKVHHSILELDWLGSLRFHWMEIVIYKIIQYPILAMLGFDYKALFVLAIISTAIGHFNHANLRFNIGPFKYFINSPEMHSWHHVHPNHGPVNKNFGINLSMWDWIFRTAYLPQEKADPKALGFTNMESFPTNIFGQEIWPLRFFKK